MSLQAAIEAPRALWLGGRTLLVEQGLADPTELFSLGWQPQLVPYPGGTGVAHGIERVGDSWCGCADLRGDGVALPL
jgi:Gamma-glutamyltransferase